jgi:hypothetical protein
MKYVRISPEIQDACTMFLENLIALTGTEVISGT